MKKVVWILLLMLFLSTQVNIATALDTGEKQIFETLQTMGFDQSYVALEEDQLTIRIEDPDFVVIHSVREILVMAQDAVPVSRVILEVRHEGEAVYTFAASGEEIAAYSRGEISMEAFDGGIEGESTMSIEEAISLDLGVFDALVYRVALSDKNAEIEMKYSGQSEEELMLDLPNMAYRVLFHAPWVETVSFKVDHHEEAKALVITFETGNLMALLQGEMALEDLYQEADISLQEDSSLLDGAIGAFKGFDGFLGPVKEYLDFGLEMLGILANEFGQWVYWAVGVALLMPFFLLFKIIRGILRLFKRKRTR